MFPLSFIFHRSLAQNLIFMKPVSKNNPRHLFFPLVVLSLSWPANPAAKVLDVSWQRFCYVVFNVQLLYCTTIRRFFKSMIWLHFQPKLCSWTSRFLDFQHLTTDFVLAKEFLDQRKGVLLSCLPMRKYSKLLWFKTCKKKKSLNRVQMFRLQIQIQQMSILPM
jgi:hypothetical protein